jgi:hypothetical protein
MESFQIPDHWMHNSPIFNALHRTMLNLFVIIILSCINLLMYCENLTTIPVELGFLWHFVLLSLKTCSLYHEKLFIQKFKDIKT